MFYNRFVKKRSISLSKLIFNHSLIEMMRVISTFLSYKSIGNVVRKSKRIRRFTKGETNF